jgi:hypothetical protein
MSTTPSPDDFLLGGSSGKSAFGKDDPIGTTVSGVIIAHEVRQQTDMETGSPMEWDNGDPRMQLVVSLQTDQRIAGEPDDDGIRAIYVKGSKAPGSRSLHDAVRAAVQGAGAKGIEPGGTLTVQLVGTEPSKTRGFNDRKLWAAAYKAPDHAAATGGFLGTVGGQPAPYTAPVSAPAPAPVSAPVPLAPVPVAPAPVAAAAPAATPAQTAKSLAALGMTAEQIAPQLGLDVNVVAMLIAA